MKRIFSGVKPTGPLHLGNYLGALRNWVALQHEYESFFCIVNLHAITLPQDPKLLAEKTRELARIYLAVGIDPKISTVFVQSDLPQHSELTCDLAIRFNRDYGETFRVPDPFIPKVGARIMSLSDPMKKMSKSDDDPNGCVMLLDDADTVQRKIKRAVTDSGMEIRFDESRPAITNLLTIYHLITGQQPHEVEEYFAGKGYAQLKSQLADVTVEFLRPIQQRVGEITDERLNDILNQGREKAGKIASATLKE